MSDEFRHFQILALDPNGTVYTADFQAPIIPRVGDHLALPDGTDWQNMTVIGVYLRPDRVIVVELGGTEGWDTGSVRALFEAALDWMLLNGAWRS